MIQQLHITNYALISEIDINFQSGLNIITGETGAGKSIIMGALSLLQGGRADMKAIRDKSQKTVIEATFSTAGLELLHATIAEYDIDWYDDTCILRRELSPSGRSRAFINDTPVTLQQLHDVAVHLVDIHSQHQNLMLADHDYQLSILDKLAENTSLLEQYRAAFDAYKDAIKKYTETRDMIMRNRADAEFISFQLEQLNDMNLQPGEQEALERDRDVLANMSQIKEHLSGALDALTGRDGDALGALAICADHLQSLSDVLDDAGSLTERLESARLEIKDIAETLQEYDGDMNADPIALENIEERLGRIYSLEAKHHVDTSDDLMALRDKLKAQLDAIDNADEQLASLHEEAKSAKRAATVVARSLSERRHAVTRTFADELRDSAQPLGMKNLRCDISMTPGKLQPTGFDNVEFKFAFNKNQPLMAVSDGASGGEISRLILSIKLVIAEKMQLPTIVFDEVDTGVSGDVALKMACLMSGISNKSQVIAITHLPQVAAKGATHFKVYKQDDEQSTSTYIKCLTPEERVAELALMLSGNPSDPAARATAQRLLQHS